MTLIPSFYGTLLSSGMRFGSDGRSMRANLIFSAIGFAAVTLASTYPSRRLSSWIPWEACAGEFSNAAQLQRRLFLDPGSSERKELIDEFLSKMLSDENACKAVARENCTKWTIHFAGQLLSKADRDRLKEGLGSAAKTIARCQNSRAPDAGWYEWEGVNPVDWLAPAETTELLHPAWEGDVRPGYRERVFREFGRWPESQPFLTTLFDVTEHYSTRDERIRAALSYAQHNRIVQLRHWATDELARGPDSRAWDPRDIAFLVNEARRQKEDGTPADLYLAALVTKRLGLTIGFRRTFELLGQPDAFARIAAAKERPEFYDHFPLEHRYFPDEWETIDLGAQAPDMEEIQNWMGKLPTDSPPIPPTPPPLPRPSERPWNSPTR